MSLRSRFAPLFVGALLTACGGGTETPSVGPNDIPALEAAVQQSPGDAGRLTLLGVAYYNAARYQDAADVLERAVATGEAVPVAHLHRGLAHEATENWQGASDAYAAFLASAPEDSDLRDEIEQRMPLVERRLMETQLRALLAQEAALANQAAEPRTVAVFPFRVVAEDPRYQPLQFALADMVTTDLGIPGSLQLLERAQIQALVQEMALSLAGYTDASSGARVGRLMRAEHVVQGSVVLLGEERLRLEMAVVDPALGAREGEATDETELERIFDVEKQLVMEVLGLLGVTLTAAEREAIEENRTSSLLAFLAYGEGLEAMVRGDYAAATASFQRAAEIDPGFRAARTRGEEAAGLQQAAETTTTDLALAAAGELPTQAAEPATAPAVFGEVLPDINRSDADQYGTNDPRTDVNIASGDDTINDDDSGAIGEPEGVRVPIVIDNPNVE